MKKILLILSVLIFLVSIVFVVYNWKMVKYYEPWRMILEKTSLVKNKLIVEASPNINKDSLSFYFIKQPENLQHPVYDTITLYDRGEVINFIPDEYGGNSFMLKYKGITYNKMGLWKRKAWYKHDYKIQVFMFDSSLVINWNIQNKYESESGGDTIRLNNYQY